MKENIQKLAEKLATVATFLKEENVDQAVETLAEVATDIEALSTEAETVDNTLAEKDTELATANEEIEKNKVEIEKYSSLSISSEDLPSLFAELAAVKQMITDMPASMATMMKDSQTPEFEAVKKSIEEIASATESRQIREEKREEITKGISGLDLDPRS